MKKIIKAGAVDQTIDIFVQNSSSTTGAGLTGLVYNSASLVCYYRKGATGSATALTLATQTVGGAHSDGGFVEIDATNMPGMYRLDLSDTIVATAGSVTLMLKGATNMAPLPIELQVVAVNLEDSVRMGMTALPNAAADAAGGLPISDAGGLDMDSIKTDTAAILVDTGTDGVVVAAGSKTGYSLTATTGLGNQTANITGNVSGSVGSVTAGVTVAAGGIISGAHAAAELNTIADAILDRNMATGTDSGTDSTAVRTMRQALRTLRNKAAIAAGTLTVYKEDDVTASFTAAITTTAGNPVSSADPT